jgi:hypothetical protein
VSFVANEAKVLIFVGSLTQIMTLRRLLKRHATRPIKTYIGRLIYNASQIISIKFPSW